MRLTGIVFSAFSDFLKSDIGIILCVVVGLIIAVSVFLYVRVKTKKSRLLKSIHVLNKSFVEVQSLPIQAKLVKIEQIGDKNVVFARLCEEYTTLYEQIRKTYEPDLKKEFELAKEQVHAGDYLNLNETMKGLHIKLQAYKDKMYEVDRLVSSVTQDEESIIAKAKNIKTILSECREIFVLNQEELKIFAAEYEEVFAEIQANFDIYDDHLIRGNYTDAKEVLISLERIVVNLHKNITIAPKYANLATKVIPSKINLIIDEYTEMQTKGYPLYHIFANSTVSTVKDLLGQVIYSIKMFQFDGLENLINSIMDKINELRGKLEKEKENCLQFESEWMDIYNKAEDLERLYIKNMKDITRLSKVYEIGERTNSLANAAKVEVNKLSVIRRTLDSLNYGKQPYSTRLVKMQELKEQITVVEEAINTYRNNFEDMRDNSEDAYDLVNEATVKLKNLQLAVRNTKIEKLKQNFNDEFALGYNLIEKLGNIISYQPIDVDRVNKYYGDLKVLVERIEKEATLQIKKAEYTEKLIMFANSYRSQFAEVARNCAKAELYFFDARFDEAIEMVKESLKRYIDISLFEYKNSELEGVIA
ncbi:MAG: hypothetical protein IJV94_01650 [Bacilli bacterium]|nr:hypothetical protein [Bacilli bacterium]